MTIYKHGLLVTLSAQLCIQRDGRHAGPLVSGDTFFIAIFSEVLQFTQIDEHFQWHDSMNATCRPN